MESVVTVRVPQESKELARANLGRLGLSLSDYLRAALEFMSSSRELPADFELLVSEERADARLMNLENLFDLVDHAEYKGLGHPAAGCTAADDDAEFERLMLERFDG